MSSINTKQYSFWKRSQESGTALLLGLIVFLLGFDVAIGQSRSYLDDKSILVQDISDQLKTKENLMSINLINVNIEEALEILSEKLQVGFSYNPDLIPEKKVNFKMTNVPAHLIIYKLLEGTNLRPVLPSTKDVIILREKVIPDQKILQQTVSGTVVDAQSGEALPGVNVIVVGSAEATGNIIGTTTNIDGEYDIVVPDDLNTIAFTYVGYLRQEVEIDDRNTINIDLNPDITGLEELVVIGYGQQQREDITGAISSVSGEDLQKVSTSNVSEALQGQAAGVLVTQSSGNLGGNMDIMIRGAATLGSTSPLFVIDGVPTDGNLSQLNTANITSMEILKDASAAAIYGSRAANGVVLITTNRGESGDIQVQVQARGGVSSIPDSRRIDMMNSEEFYEYSVDAYTNAGLPIPTSWQEPNLSQNLQQNTDWLDELFQPGSVQNYNVTVSGGNENAIYSFTAGYLDQKGTIVGNGFNRGSFRLNSEFYIGENQRLTIGESFELSQSTVKNNVGGADILKETFQQSPTVPLRCPENVGGFCGPTTQNSPGFRLNQVALRYLNDDKDMTQRLIGTAYARYKILPNLTYQLNLSTDYATGLNEGFSPIYDLVSNVNADADLGQTRFVNRAIIIENTVNYNTILKEVHEIELLGGYTQEQERFESLTGTARNFPAGHLRTIDAALGQTTVSGGATESALQSFLGRAVYEYDSKYRMQVAVRRDGSSRFGSESRWGTFPSVSGSWTVTNESFMENYKNTLNRLSLRASWGLTGTQNIPDFASIATINPVANYVFGEGQTVSAGSATMQVGNSKLQWQETEQIDIGLDAGFLDGKLDLVVDYFSKNTTNLLLRVPIVTSSGFFRNNGAFQNVGEVVNSGFEFSASYQESSGNFSYQLRANLATVKNEVKDIGVPSIIAGQSDELGQGQTITRPGSEIGSFYGYISEGPFVDQSDVDGHATQPGAEPGDLKFRDLNGDGIINSDDRTIIGSPFPDFFYGFTANLNYKQWGLRVQVDGVQGRDIFALRSDNDVKGFNNVTRDYLDRWTPDNQDGAHPRAVTTDPNSNLRSSTYRVKDGSYLAVRNITLDYTVDPSAISNLVNVTNLRLFATGSNLFWLTPYEGFNPEMGAGQGNSASLTRSFDNGTYPVARTLELGIEVGF